MKSSSQLPFKFISRHFHLDTGVIIDVSDREGTPQCKNILGDILLLQSDIKKGAGMLDKGWNQGLVHKIVGVSTFPFSYSCILELKIIFHFCKKIFFIFYNKLLVLTILTTKMLT